MRRIDTGLLDPLPYGRTHDQTNGPHALMLGIMLLRGGGNAIRHGLPLVGAALANGALHAAPLLVRGQRSDEHTTAVIKGIIDQAT